MPFELEVGYLAVDKATKICPSSTGYPLADSKGGKTVHYRDANTGASHSSSYAEMIVLVQVSLSN